MHSALFILCTYMYIYTYIYAVELVLCPPAMLKKQEDHQPPPVYLPCWKCYGHKLCDQTPPTDVRLDGNWVFHDTNPVYCFTLKESIVPAAQGQDLECPIHGKIQIMHMAPDLVCQKLMFLLIGERCESTYDIYIFVSNIATYCSVLQFYVCTDTWARSARQKCTASLTVTHVLTKQAMHL